jgi:hypothetical protein
MCNYNYITSFVKLIKSGVAIESSNKSLSPDSSNSEEQFNLYFSWIKREIYSSVNSKIVYEKSLNIGYSLDSKSAVGLPRINLISYIFLLLVSLINSLTSLKSC